MTKLASTLPKDNGLPGIHQQLIDHPDRAHLVIAVLDTKKITTDIDTGDVEATVRVGRVEVVLPGDREQAMRLLTRAVEHRTGETVLPLDTEQELRKLLGLMRIDGKE